MRPKLQKELVVNILTLKCVNLKMGVQEEQCYGKYLIGTMKPGGRGGGRQFFSP